MYARSCRDKDVHLFKNENDIVQVQVYTLQFLQVSPHELIIHT